jgi:hypothetical protein
MILLTSITISLSVTISEVLRASTFDRAFHQGDRAAGEDKGGQQQGAGAK